MAMRTILTTIGFFIAMTLSGQVAAGTSECAIIKDHDDRMMCYAVVTKSASWCAFIKSSDLRVKCHVTLGK